MSAKDQEVNTGKPDAAGGKILTRGRGGTDWAESGGGKARSSDETSNDQHPLAPILFTTSNPFAYRFHCHVLKNWRVR
jgi:hypothetical protein